MNLLRQIGNDARDEARRTVVRATLRETAGNVRAAARALGMDDNNLRRELRRLGVDLGELRRTASPDCGVMR